MFPTSVIHPVAFSQAVRKQLQVDAFARRFIFCDLEISSAVFPSLQGLLSGMKIILQKLDQKLFILLNRQFAFASLE
jgi:hypothetical protein